MIKQQQFYIPKEEMIALLDEYTPDKDDWFNNREENDLGYKAKRALQRLDRGDRAIFLLYLKHGTFASLSEFFGCSRSIVSTKIHQIKNELKRLIEDDRCND